MFDDLKHAQRARLERLDQLFFWEGRANRRDLIQEFGISNAQAALDFKLYLERLREGGPVYDPVERTYVAAQGQGGDAPSGDLDEFLSELGGRGLFDEVPRLQRRIPLALMARLYRAMRDRRAVRLVYRSMKTAEAETRWIAPQRFASDGVRIHVRAWCFKHEQFRDFVPGRIDETKGVIAERPAPDTPFDEAWHTWALVELAPHHALSEDQRQAIREEFGFQGATMTVRIRKALLYYIDRQWGLKGDRPRLERVGLSFEPFANEEPALDAETI